MEHAVNTMVSIKIWESEEASILTLKTSQSNQAQWPVLEGLNKQG